MTVSLSKPTYANMYPGWKILGCHCCNGIKWGGDYPVECETCQGSGTIWLTPSGTSLALYPGGPFCGVADDRDRTNAKAPSD